MGLVEEVSAQAEMVQTVITFCLFSFQLATLITEWNATKSYSLTSCNCQHFVDAVLHKLGLEKVFDGIIGSPERNLLILGQYFDSIQSSSDFHFNFEYRTDSGVQTFRTHEELDQFCWDLEAKEAEEGKVPKDHWALLKAFDRAFWLRKRALDAHSFWDKGEEMQQQATLYEPLEGDKCYFGDPEDTGTIISPHKV